MTNIRPIVFAVACLSVAAAHAEDGRPSKLPSAGFAPVERIAAVVPARHRAFDTPPLSAAALAARRGGDGVANAAQLAGTVANNTATQVQTGSNAVSDGAFTGSAGLATVIQNSGNNVLIQNSVIVNVQMK